MAFVRRGRPGNCPPDVGLAEQTGEGLLALLVAGDGHGLGLKRL